MADEDKTIRVDVGRDLLAVMETPPPKSKVGCKARLARYRQQFAQIAALKYHEGQFEPEVRVLVVRITADDLA